MNDIDKDFNCIDTGSKLAFTQDRNSNQLTAYSEATKIEPSQRLDHIIACRKIKDKALIVGEAKLIFNQANINVGNLGTKVQLSDHFGVETKIQF